MLQTNTSMPTMNSNKGAVCTKKHRKKLKKLCDRPEARFVTVTADGNLAIKGQNEILVENFVLVSWRGVFAKTNGALWQPKGQDTQLPAEIGVLTGTNCYLKVSDNNLPGLFLDGEISSPQPEMPVLLFAWTEKFCEFFVITPSVSKPFRLLRPMTEGLLLRGLVLDIMRAYMPDVHEDLCQFLKEAESHG